MIMVSVIWLIYRGFRFLRATYDFVGFASNVRRNSGLMEQSGAGRQLPTGYHAIEMAHAKPGDHTAVCGAGPVARMAAYSAILKGASKVMVVDRHRTGWSSPKRSGHPDRRLAGRPGRGRHLADEGAQGRQRLRVRGLPSA